MKPPPRHLPSAFAFAVLLVLLIPAKAIGQEVSCLDSRPENVQEESVPALLNADSVADLLEDEYPKDLKKKKIGAAIVVWIFVDCEGLPIRTHIRVSSGYPDLDAAADRVAQQMRFQPALIDDVPVGVWIAQPIEFSVV